MNTKLEKTDKIYQISEKSVSAVFTLVGLKLYHTNIYDEKNKKIGEIGFDKNRYIGVTDMDQKTIVEVFNLKNDPGIMMFRVMSPEYVFWQDEKWAILKNPENPALLYRIPKGLIKDVNLIMFPHLENPCVIKTTTKYYVIVAPKHPTPEDEKKREEQKQKAQKKEVKVKEMEIYGEKVNKIQPTRESKLPSWIDEIQEQVSTTEILNKVIVIKDFVKLHSAKYDNDFIIARIKKEEGEKKWITSTSVVISQLETYKDQLPFACKVIKPKGKRYYLLDFDIDS